jgi:imidazole glycerol-phosphate synthase subunit HisH
MQRQRVAVVDYGMGNLHSVSKALARVAPQAEVLVTDDRNAITAADRVVFPGVGAIRDCMSELRRRGLEAPLREAIASRPVLAICVGLQALLTASDENGGTPCFDILHGQVRRFPDRLEDDDGVTLKVPHMGWNVVHQRRAHPLWSGIAQDTRFYFVHSYYACPIDLTVMAASCEYGVEFAAALCSDRLFAVQFHPEKSHTAGLQLLSNFMAWNGRD